MLSTGRVVLAHGMGQAYKNVRTRAVAVERGGDGLPAAQLPGHSWK